MIALIDVESLFTQAVRFIPDLIAAGAIFYLFRLIVRLTRGPLRQVFERAHMEPGLVSLFVDRIYTTLVMIFGVIMAAAQLGINVMAALAGLSVAGIAIGFAAQDTLSNIIAGIVVFWDQPFRVGDYVSIGEHYGEVREITLRSTRIRTHSNTFVVMPNRTVVDGVLVNRSQDGAVRLEVPVGIAYKESIAEARQVLLAAAKTVEGVLSSPAPDVVATGLGESSVDLLLRAWIADARDEKPVYFRLVETAKTSLDAAGIEIPFPHRQLLADPATFRIGRGEE